MIEPGTTGEGANRTTILLTCMDPRFDPLTHYASLKLERPFIIRNPGGRVTPTALRDIAITHYLVTNRSGGDAHMHLVIVHHTDCRTAGLQDAEARRALSEDYGVDANEAAALAIGDPALSVRDDIALLRNSLKVPGAVTVSGHVYDIEKEELMQVEAPAPLRK